MIDLRENERVILLKRRHWVILKLELAPLVLVFFGGIAALVVVPFLNIPPMPEMVVSALPLLEEIHLKHVILALIALFNLFVWQIIFVVLATFYLDSWIITNERTIHTELKALFSRVSSSVPHARIQDITVDVHGILATVFSFGNLQIQTAGKFQEFKFRQVPDPQGTKEAIFRAQKEYFDTFRQHKQAPPGGGLDLPGEEGAPSESKT